MDITDFPDLDEPLSIAQPSLPSFLSFQAAVSDYFQYINMDLYSSTLTHLSTYPTRFYKSTTGVTSALWILDQYKSYASGRSDITFSTKSHSGFEQPSLIIRFEGSGSNSNEVVVIGGHIDSTSSGSVAPGADDDGSGSMGVLEAFRVLAQNGFKPSRTVEFHGYAAEENGLLGSQGIVTDFKKDGRVVVGMLQLDMIGYYAAGSKPSVSIVTDFTNGDLNEVVRKLVDSYLSIGWINDKCGYGCSDHASWTKGNYRASFPFEAKFGTHYSPFIHTASDTISKINFAHAKEFIKLGISFVVELGSVN